MNISDIHVTFGSKRLDGSEVRALEGARMRHQRPCRLPPPTEAGEGCSGLMRLWVTPVHASSMVESTADDHLTVDGDANVCRRR